MKGTIHYCLEETIKKFHGDEGWEAVAEANGYEADFSFATKIRDDIDEKHSIDLFVKGAETLQIPLTTLFDQFGEYWCCEYAPQVYGAFYRGLKGTKEGVTRLDRVHDTVTRHIPNAAPPRFIYNWIHENELELTYKSDRNLLDLFISLVKGLDKNFNEETEIIKLNDYQVILKFGVVRPVRDEVEESDVLQQP